MDKATQTMLANIQKRSGKSLDELTALVRASGLTRHGQAVAMLKDKLGMGHGDANMVAHLTFTPETVLGAASPSTETAGAEADLDRIYTGPKGALRPIHDAVMTAVGAFGPFEIAPKKTYLSLRRKKQFATVGPATNTRVEVGLNMKDVPGTTRLEALPPGGMCQYRVKITSPAEVDKELLAWIRRAYDAAG